MSDDVLAALIPAASSTGARRGWRCPDESELAGWVERRLPEARREELADHLADCAFCRGQAGFLSRAASLGPPPPVPVALLEAATGRRQPLFGFFRPATLAAAGAGLALALLVAGPLGRTARMPGAPASDGQVRTGLILANVPALLQPSEGQVVPGAALELRWREVPDALSYTVQIVSPAGDVVWEGRADGARLTVPANAALAPGQACFAWVVAHLRSGATVRSPAVGFRLAPG